MMANEEKYDLILVGSSFASSFFLHKYLHKARKDSRILVLEKGRLHTFAWQIKNKRQSALVGRDFYRNVRLDHEWVSNIEFGGNSNCWWACVPRMFPSDFEILRKYNVGFDWPISYRDLEPYYDEAESIMAVSGPDNSAIYPGKKPYPLPPHNLNAPDKVLQKAFPSLYFAQPTARASKSTSQRPRCCANGVCGICPINAKFTVLNGMQSVYSDPRVELKLEADVIRLDIEGGLAKGVVYATAEGRSKRLHVARSEVVGLGANALFNPQILMNSGDTSASLGKGINEQVSFYVQARLNGLENYQGSTSITGHGYMLYDGDHRKEHAACLIENYNIPILRATKDRWTQTMQMKFIFEDIPSDENYLKLDSHSERNLIISYGGHSAYTQRAIDKVKSVYLEKILSHLPVENYEISDLSATEAHILGTTRMGMDANTSVVSGGLVHHKWNNVLVLGSGTFPTSAPANPTLTIAALSLKSADELL